MQMSLTALLLLGVLGLAQSLQYNDLGGAPYQVSFDHRAFKINGQRLLVQSGAIHYPRSTPAMWPRLMQLTKAANINTIETYVFWDQHESAPGVYDFTTGRRNLRAFLQSAADAGLFVILRIGPYSCAEWSYGGLPVWLRDISNISFRTVSPPWQEAMRSFVTRSLQEVDSFLSRNGGPIFLLQIENEYGNIEIFYGTNGAFECWYQKEKDDLWRWVGCSGARYVQWAADLALSYNTSTPWIMCQQGDAPAAVVNTCNGHYCDGWLAGHFKKFPNQPGGWTENWQAFFNNWGQPKPTRPVQDVAFALARFIARGGSLHNHYMFHGGTNFGRTAGGPFIVTSYDYDSPLNEYGYPSEPKYSHLATLQSILDEYSSVIVDQDQVPEAISLGLLLEAHIYTNATTSIIFFSNIGFGGNSTVSFQGRKFVLPPWSVTLVDRLSGKVIFNTAQISSTVKSVPIKYSGAGVLPISLGWIAEPLGVRADAISAPSPLEQIAVTRDKSDYLWYWTEVAITPHMVNTQAHLSVAGDDYFQIYVNDVYQGAAKHSLKIPLSLDAPGVLRVAILCMTNGLVNFGIHFESYRRGLSQVSLDRTNLMNGVWHHGPELVGEKKRFFDQAVTPQLPWQNVSEAANRTLTWWRLEYSLTPPENSTWVLDLGAMGKGSAWVNGHMIGRFWDIVAKGSCSIPCDYRGFFYGTKCTTGCNQPTQRYYHVPTEWLLDVDASGLVQVVLLAEQAAVAPQETPFMRLY